MATLSTEQQATARQWIAEGMKIFTRSPKAITAQKGVMEFLLINHPLDCPICDQGGECQLQDLAVGYGGSASKYQEPKRVVKDKDLGPLIATDMTRCIHCSRCVRFGQEIAGLMELGMPGRLGPVNAIHFGGAALGAPPARVRLAFGLDLDDFRGRRDVQLLVRHWWAA
jgi:NADH-quinone oxidoreductase subunit G